MYLFIMIAYLPHGAIPAFRGAGGADLPSKMDDAMAEIRLLRYGNHRREDPFHPERVFQFFVIESQATADADTVGIRHDAAFFIDIAEEEIGDLASDTGKFAKLFYVAWQFSTVFVVCFEIQFLKCLRV